MRVGRQPLPQTFPRQAVPPDTHPSSSSVLQQRQVYTLQRISELKDSLSALVSSRSSSSRAPREEPVKDTPRQPIRSQTDGYQNGLFSTPNDAVDHPSRFSLFGRLGLDTSPLHAKSKGSSSPGRPTAAAALTGAADEQYFLVNAQADVERLTQEKHELARICAQQETQIKDLEQYVREGKLRASLHQACSPTCTDDHCEAHVNEAQASPSTPPPPSTASLDGAHDNTATRLHYAVADLLHRASICSRELVRLDLAPPPTPPPVLGGVGRTDAAEAAGSFPTAALMLTPAGPSSLGPEAPVVASAEDYRAAPGPVLCGLLERLGYLLPGLVSSARLGDVVSVTGMELVERLNALEEEKQVDYFRVLEITDQLRHVNRVLRQQAQQHAKETAELLETVQRITSENATLRAQLETTQSGLAPTTPPQDVGGQAGEAREEVLKLQESVRALLDEKATLSQQLSTQQQAGEAQARELATLKRTLEEAESANRELTGQLASALARQHETERQNAELRSRLERLTQESEEALQEADRVAEKERQRQGEASTQLSRECDSLRSQCADLQQQLTELRSTLESEKEEGSKVNAKLSASEKRVVELYAAMQAAEQAHQAKAGQEEETRLGQLAAVETELARTRAALEAEQASSRAGQTQIASLHASLDALRTELEAERAKTAELTSGGAAEALRADDCTPQQHATTAQPPLVVTIDGESRPNDPAASTPIGRTLDEHTAPSPDKHDEAKHGSPSRLQALLRSGAGDLSVVVWTTAVEAEAMQQELLSLYEENTHLRGELDRVLTAVERKCHLLT